MMKPRTITHCIAASARRPPQSGHRPRINRPSWAKLWHRDAGLWAGPTSPEWVAPTASLSRTIYICLGGLVRLSRCLIGLSALIADDCFQWAQRKHRALLATSYECDGTERHCFFSLAAWRRVRSDRGRAGSTTHYQASWGSASAPTRQYGECHAQKPYRCQLSKLAR
jgi:hypothetical protein